MQNYSLNRLSEQLLLAVKTGEESETVMSKIAETTLAKYFKEINSDDSRKAFWINIYNAFFQILRKEQNIEKPRIYREKLVKVAGQEFSLDDIEHGILRKYRSKFSLGYLPNPVASKLIKKLAVKKIDYRIHFALNCGAKSCPPIAFYSPYKINNQLDLATASFLESETEIFEEKKKIHITRLFRWFSGDFGGRSGIRKILKNQIGLETKGYGLVYKEYSREESLDNYIDLK